MTREEYWEEACADAFDDVGAYEVWKGLTADQQKRIGANLEGAADSQSMAFYSPPPSDRINEIEREWKRKYDALKAEFERYQGNAETAVKIALRQYSDASVSIGEHGEVKRYGGRIERIQ